MPYHRITTNSCRLDDHCICTIRNTHMAYSLFYIIDIWLYYYCNRIPTTASRSILFHYVASFSSDRLPSTSTTVPRTSSLRKNATRTTEHCRVERCFRAWCALKTRRLGSKNLIVVIIIHPRRLYVILIFLPLM